MAEELQINVTAMFSPLGGILQIEVMKLLGIHCTNLEEYLFYILAIYSSTSPEEIDPRKIAAAELITPRRGSTEHI